MREFKNLSNNVFSESFLDEIMGLSSHSQEHSKSDEYILNRLFADSPLAVSRFESKDILNELLIQTISYNQKNIDEWLYNSNDLKYPIKLTLPKDDYDCYVGSGFKLDKKTGKIAEYQTENIFCLLKKDFNRPYGFILTTVYPDLMADTAVKTERDITTFL